MRLLPRSCRFSRLRLLLLLLATFVLLLYYLLSGPELGHRHIILERNLQRPEPRIEQILTKNKLYKRLDYYDETNLNGLNCQTSDTEVDWSFLKSVFMQDFELNLIDLGIDCGFLALAAAKFGRHVVAIDENGSKIKELGSSVYENGIDPSLIQYYHLSRAKFLPGRDLQTILDATVFHRAVLKIQGQFQKDQVDVVRKIIKTKDIFAIMIVENSNCRVFQTFIDDFDYFPVNPYLKPIRDPCRSPALWLRRNEEPQIKGNKHVANIINPDKIPSLLNYINCIPVSCAQGKEICYSTVDKYIGRDLERKGTWDNFVWHPMKRILDNDPELGLIDVGANIGVFSISAAAMGRQVLAIEAFYENVQRLSEALRINKFHSLVTLIHNAVSDAYETMYFRSPVDNPGGTVAHQALKDTMASYRGRHSSVQSLTLNDLVYLAPRKAVLKVDIEGSELQAFQAVDKILDKVEIPAIFMEWTGIKKNDFCMYIVEMLRKRGYSPYGLHWRGFWLKGYQRPLYGETWSEIKHWSEDIVWLR